MPAEGGRKRGRPMSGETGDAAIQQRRQQTAERVRQHRERRRAAAAAATAAATAAMAIMVPQTRQQSQQVEAIAERPFEEQEAAQTLLELGLRVQNVTLAEDTYDAKLQQDATHVDEHDELYGDDNLIATGN